jgi:hypothetical protein
MKWAHGLRKVGAMVANVVLHPILQSNQKQIRNRLDFG